MTTIEVRPTKNFGGGWAAVEAPGVEPAFVGPQAREYALSYARGRFGDQAGQIHVYEPTGAVIEEIIQIEGRERR
jgi:hypothetical protein